MNSVKINVIAALLVIAASAPGQAQTANLLINPGAESGSLAPWSQGGDSAPGVDNGTFDSGISPHAGGFDFTGNRGEYGSLSQWVGLSGLPGVTPQALDSGKLLANVSFWEQGLSQGVPSDDGRVTLLFLNDSSNIISTVTSGEIDSHGSWSNYTSSFSIPVGTRSILYLMEFVRHSGSDNDSFIDDNALTISTARPSLDIFTAKGSVVLSWPAAFSDSALESTTSLVSPNWTPVTEPSYVVGSRIFVTNALAADWRFFRLHAP